MTKPDEMLGGNLRIECIPFWVGGGGGKGSSDTASRLMQWKPGKIRLYGPLLGSSTDFTNPVSENGCY